MWSLPDDHHSFYQGCHELVVNLFSSASEARTVTKSITKIVMQRKYGHIYNFFMRLKELQVNKVPIFTRLKSYQSIVKKHYESFGIE